MNKEINYPIKYAVLELKEKGGYLVGYEDITLGFIVSKCYVTESSIIYISDGSNKGIHKVVFPFQDIESFKMSLRNGRQNIGNAEIPQYDACGRIYPINIVTDLFDSYELAKESAEEKNEEHRCNLISKVPTPIPAKLSNTNWQKQHEELKQEFENGLEICYLFEQLVLAATRDMDISEEVTTNDQKSFVKTLKPINKQIANIS